MGIRLRFPTVSKCCFCLPLRVGSLIIGYISIVASLFAISGASFYIYKVATFVQENKGKPITGTQETHSPEELQKIALALYLSFGYYILVFLFNLVLHVFLVVGVHMNKPVYLKRYCMIAYFLFAMSVTLVVITFVFTGFFATIPMLKWSFTLFVCIIVVRSTYMEMEDQQKPKVYGMVNLYRPPSQPSPLIV